MIQFISLHGDWKRSIAGTAIDFVKVPGGYPPVGACELELEFACPDGFASEGFRLFLCLEGVLSSASFLINGVKVGEAGPYAPYRFELPDGLLAPRNVIRAFIRDITEEFGPTPGRKFEGGLFRQIWIERRPSCFIEDVAFDYELSEDYGSASCKVAAALSCKGRGASVSCELIDNLSGKPVAKKEAKCGGKVSFQVQSPRLWSPERPDLYTLQVRLDNGDAWEDVVGFRTIEVSGRDFLLNGKRVILKGVCRHEFNEACGYAVPEEFLRHELRRIKHAGLNYVRLVHHPHSRMAARIAAELGLLVTEEPGLCFHDLADERLAGPGLESLRRLVLRDRNCPSVFAWLIYNECNPDAAYAARAAGMCRELDPKRLVSMADCSGRDGDIKQMASAANLSYYGVNIYNAYCNPFENRMDVFADKPFVLTEWGGGIAQGNPRVLKGLCDSFVRCSRAGSARRLAGCAFWAWADYEERSRGEAICSPNGYTIEGLCDLDGHVKNELSIISQMCFEMDYETPSPQARVEVLARRPARKELWLPIPLEKAGGAQEGLENELACSRRIERVKVDYSGRAPRFGRLMVDGIEFRCRDEDGLAPLMIGPGCEELSIPVGRKLRRIAVLGHVALKGGYPSNAVHSVHHRDSESLKELGSPASEYEFVFEDGSVAQPLLHGVHILRSNNIVRWFMSSPRGVETIPAVQAMLHRAFEEMRFDLWEKDFGEARTLKEIRWRLKDPSATQAMLAISCARD